MADPLSLIASVVGIIEPVISRLDALGERVRLFADLSPSLETLRARCAPLRLIFDEIRSTLSGPHLHLSTPRFDYLRVELANCDANIEQLNAVLNDVDNLLPDPRSSRILPVVRGFTRARTVSAKIESASILVERVHDTAKFLILILRPVGDQSEAEEAPARFSLTALTTALHGILQSHNEQTQKSASSSSQDAFTPARLVPRLDRNTVLQFHAVATPEARILRAALAAEHGSTVAVYGSGGVGKTTLALALAHRPEVHTAFPGGTYFLSFGQHASTDTLRSNLAEAVRVSGGAARADSITRAESSLEATNAAEGWFSNRRVLIVCDDLWASSSSSCGHFSDLVAVAKNGNAVVVTTRDNELASLADTAIRVTPEAEVRGERARDILLAHAGAAPEDFTSDGAGTLDRVLEVCCGVPLTLAVAGRTVRTLRLANPDDSFCDCLDDFYERLRNYNEAGIGNERLPADSRRNYSFFATVRASLSTADEWIGVSERSEQSDGNVSVPALFRRLCILPRQTSVPEAVLRRAWADVSEHQAKRVVDRLVSLNLLSKTRDAERRQLFGLHDLVLDFVQAEARENCEFVDVHRSFLDSFFRRDEQVLEMREELERAPRSRDSTDEWHASDFSAEVLESATRAWWEVGDIPEREFLLANVARLLLDAGHDEELVGLLCDARWLVHRGKQNGAVQLQHDYASLLTRLCNPSGDSETQRVHHGLQTMGAIVVTLADESVPTKTICVDTSSRLLDLPSTHTAPVQRLLSTARAVVKRPAFEAKQRYWDTAIGSACRVVPMQNSVHVLGADFRRKLARVVVFGYHEVQEIDFRTGTGSLVRRVQLPSGGRVFAMRPDGGMLALRVADELHFWDCETHEVVWTIDAPRFNDDLLEINAPATGQAFSWDNSNNVLYVPVRHGGVDIYDVGSEAVGALSCERGGKVVSVACSETPRRVAALKSDNSMTLWEAGSETWTAKVVEVTEERLVYRSLFMDRCGNHIVAGGMGVVRMWTWSDETPVSTWQLEQPLCRFAVCCGVLADNGNGLVTSTYQGTINWHDKNSGTIVRSLQTTTFSSLALVASDCGRYVVVGGNESVVRWLDRDGVLLLGALETVSGTDLASLHVSRNGTRAIAASRDLGIKTWQVGNKDRAELLECQGITGCVSVDGRVVVVGEAEGTISWWEAETLTLLRRWEACHGPIVLRMALSDDSSRVVSIGYSDGNLRWWDGGDGRLLASCALKDHLGDTDMTKLKMSVSGDAKRCVVIAENTVLFFNIHEVVESTIVQPCARATWTEKLSAVGMSADGEIIATGDNEGGLQLWKWANEEPVRRSEDGHHCRSRIKALAVRDDGGRIFIAGADHTVSLWDAMGDDERRGVPRYVKRTFARTNLEVEWISYCAPDDGSGSTDLVTCGAEQGGVWTLEVIADQ